MPIVWSCCGVVLGVVLAPWLQGFTPPQLVCFGTLAALLAIFMRGTLRAPGAVGRLLAGLFGLATGLLLVATVPRGPVLRGPISVRGIVVGVSSGGSADIAVSAWAAPGQPWTAAGGRIRCRFPERSPPLGAAVLARGDGRDLGGPLLPGAPDPVRAAGRAGIRTQLRVDAFEILGGGPRGRRPSDGTGVLRAVAVGDRSGVDERSWELLRRTGTAHLLAISGFHVGIVGLIVGGSVRLLCLLLTAIRPVGWPSSWSWIAAAGAGFVYVAAAGGPVSAQRAAWGLAWIAVAKVCGRVSDPLALLGVAAVAVLVVDPAAVASPSMQLSFGAVVGIVRITPWILRWIPPDVPMIIEWAINGMAVTISATLGTLPAAAWWFQDVAPLSPVANLIAMPVMALVVVPCANLAVWGPEWLSGLAALVGTTALGGMFAALIPLALEPLHPAVGPVGAIFLIAPILWPNRPSLVLPIVVCALGLREVPTTDRVTFLDVGQGDAALVELASGERILVDGGPPSNRVLGWLRRRGIGHLDAVVITHGDADHVGGAVPVLQSLRVDELWMGDRDGMQDALRIAEERGIEVVSKPLPFEGASRNDRSLVVLHSSTLFTGDIGREAEAALASTLTPVPVLKVPHHGSRSSSSDALLDATQPQLAVIGVGRRNLYRHPHHTVIRRYQERGIEVLRTDLDGTIEITFRPDAMIVRTFRAGRGWSVPRSVARPARAIQKHAQGDDGEADRDTLGVRERLTEEAGNEEPARLVAAEGLEHRPPHGIEHQVQQHDLTIEALPAVEDVHDHADGEQIGRFVQLGGVHGNGEGGHRVRIGEAHRPGQIRLSPPATARREAPESRDPVGDGDGGGKDVPHREVRHLEPAHQVATDRQDEDDRAIEDQAAVADVDPVVERDSMGRVLDQVHHARSNQRRDGAPKDQIGGSLGLYAEGACPVQSHGRNEQKASCSRRPIGVDLEVADTEQDGMHHTPLSVLAVRLLRRLNGTRRDAL